MRRPQEVMRLARLGSSYPTRLSFMRTLVRRMSRERWRFDLPLRVLDADGYGHVVYRVRAPARSYCLVAFSHYLDPALRNDRVIAEAWDATFVLFDGEPTGDDIARLSRSVPLQEAARFSPTELVLSRANRSVRMFEHTVERLSRGEQPDEKLLRETGYLMRTTAVYGNGKFGVADRERYMDRAELAAPFQAEFLTVFLIREFTLDLVEHIAEAKGGPRAARLAPRLRSHFGIGNSTGLGMAPFLFTHPALLSNWVRARETALGRVRHGAPATAARRAQFGRLVDRAAAHLAEWSVSDPEQERRIAAARRDLALLRDWIRRRGEAGEAGFWEEACALAEASFSPDGQEVAFSLVIEPHGDIVDDLADTMSLRTEPPLLSTMTVFGLRRAVADHYPWAVDTDLSDPRERARFWYVSQEKREPRLGDRFLEPGAEREQPFDVIPAVHALLSALQGVDGDADVGSVLMLRPDLIHIVRRVQTTIDYPFAEVRDNLIGADCLPLHLLRCKLAFFGAMKYDPLSDRWLRVTLFQGAPLREELSRPDADDWLFPALEDIAA